MQFIGRQQWLDTFRQYVAQPQGVIWRITGQPGIGKSTLLRRLEQDCAVEGQQHPNIWLDVENFTPAHGLDVLTTMAGAAQYFDTEKANKGLKEKVGEGFKTVTGGLVSTLELAKDFIPGGELAAGAAKVVVGLGENLAGNAAQISERQAAAHPELYLLNALAAAGAKLRKPVCLVDTYEHILRADLKIKSRLLLEFKQAREGQEKEWLLSVWLGNLFEYLHNQGWCVVLMGRSVPRSKSEDQLPRFSRDEILAAVKTRPALASYIPAQQTALSDILSQLSFGGNPLWLYVAMNLLENLLAEGKDLMQLAQQPDYLQGCFEQPNPLDIDSYEGIEHGSCKLSLISTMTRPIAGLEEQAWKIALPRVLDKGVVQQLFEPQQANAILHNFTLAGVFRLSGQQFTLHEEIRDLLLAYAKSKGWLETEETRALHGKLWEYLNQLYGAKEENYPAIWMLEAIYHRIFSGVGLIASGIKPNEFWWEFSGSTLFSLAKKWQKAKALPNLSAAEVNALQDELIEQKRSLYEAIGSEIVDKLSEDLRNSVIASAWEIQYWEQRVANYGLAGDYSILSIIQDKPEVQIQTIDDMLQRFGDSVFPKVQAQCAIALFNKGVALGEKLNDPQGAIAVYDELLRRYGASTLDAVQVKCAKTLVNKGWALGEKLSDAQGAIAVYDELLHRYSASTLDTVQVQCAKALFNKGWTLGKQLNDPQGAIAVYDELLQRFGASTLDAVQEWCATALYNKGVTLSEKLNDPQGEIAAYEELLHRFGASTLDTVQVQCAMALFYKGVTLDKKLNDPQGAIAAYDELLQRCGASTLAAVQAQCAKALYSKGWTLGEKLNNPQDEIAVYDELLHRFGASTLDKVQEPCAKALVNKGVTLGEKLNDPQGAIAVYDELLHRFGASTLDAVQAQCAKALFNKGWTLGGKLNDPQDEIAVYNELLHRFGDSTLDEVQEPCVKALVNKGVTLGNRLNDPQGAIALYDEVLRRYGASTLDAVQVQCAMALYSKGWTLGEKLNNPQGEIAAYDELLQRCGASTLAAVQEPCAAALVNKGVTLGEKLNDPQGAIAVYDELLHRFGASTLDEVQAQCATALYNKGVTLDEKLNDPQGAIAVYDELLRRYGASTLDAVQAQCAKALFNKGLTLGNQLNDPQGAIAVYDELLQRFGAFTLDAVQVQCAEALFNKGVTLGRLSDLTGALTCYDELLAHYGDSDNASIQDQCTLALANMPESLLVLGQREAAIQRMHQVLARVDTNSQEYAVMYFLLWLAEAETTIHGVLTVIHALAPEVKFTWDWSDIRPYVDKLPEPRKTQAECFIAFFEQYQDRASLERCLA